MQIETFKILADLVETTSFSEAAERNGMTQSAVSQHVKVLEERFGVVLVERGRKNFSVTPEGEIFLKAGAEILQSYVGLRHELELLKNTASGSLKIVTVLTLGFHELPPYIEKFRKAWPDVKLEVGYRSEKDVYTDILDNKADLGFVAFPQALKGIAVEPAWIEPFVLICPPGHRLEKEKSISMKSLSGERFVAFKPDSSTRNSIENILFKADIDIDQVAAFDNIETVKRGVQIEGAVSIVPSGSVNREVETGILRRIDLEDVTESRPLGILRRSDKEPTRAMSAMVTSLQDRAKSEA